MSVESTSQPITCQTCRKPKAQHACSLCEADLCKKCVMAPPPGAFKLLKEVPEELAHIHYCQSCFQETVEPALQHYEDTVLLAREVFVFFTTQKARLPILKKAKDRVSIEGGDDRDETTLKLAYLAAEEGFNSIVECEIKCEKKRDADGYQHSVWSGSAFPALIDAVKLERRSD